MINVLLSTDENRIASLFHKKAVDISKTPVTPEAASQKPSKSKLQISIPSITLKKSSKLSKHQ